MRTVTSLFKVDTLKLVSSAYFHSIMSYGVIFYGNTTDSKRVFIIQNKIIRIMAGVKRRVPCRELFKKFNILPLASEFLLSLLSFIVDNMKFQTDSDIHRIAYIQGISIISISRMLTPLFIRKVLTMQRSNCSIFFQRALNV
jgi:hypothetical protein